jgi:S1-C subfamily serine protease
LEDQINSRVEALLQEQLGTLAEQIPLPQAQAEAAPPVAPIEPGLLAAYESTLAKIYDRVNPSVVSIRVVQPADTTLFQGLPELPNIPGLPEIPAIPIRLKALIKAPSHSLLPREWDRVSFGTNRAISLPTIMWSKQPPRLK